MFGRLKADCGGISCAAQLGIFCRGFALVLSLTRHVRRADIGGGGSTAFLSGTGLAFASFCQGRRNLGCEILEELQARGEAIEGGLVRLADPSGDVADGVAKCLCLANEAKDAAGNAEPVVQHATCPVGRRADAEDYAGQCDKSAELGAEREKDAPKAGNASSAAGSGGLGGVHGFGQAFDLDLHVGQGGGTRFTGGVEVPDAACGAIGGTLDFLD